MGASESSLQERHELKIDEPIPKNTGLYRIWTNVAPCTKLIQTNKKAKKHSGLLFVRNFSETDSNETKEFFRNGIQVSLKQQFEYCFFTAFEATSPPIDIDFLRKSHKVD